MPRLRVETAQFRTDDGQPYWLWGIYCGTRLVIDSGMESYPTEGQARAEGKRRLAELKEARHAPTT